MSIEEKLDLGTIIDKYVNTYGAGESISMYNTCVSMIHNKNRNYDEQSFIKLVDRFMRRGFYLKNK